MLVPPDTITTETSVEKTVTRQRATLSLRAGTVSRPYTVSGAESGFKVDRTSVSNAALGAQNSVVPLKRLTAGRKEIKIAHDGATYLLRITKSNKLILTKTEAAQAPSTS